MRVVGGLVCSWDTARVVKAVHYQGSAIRPVCGANKMCWLSLGTCRGRSPLNIICLRGAATFSLCRGLVGGINLLESLNVLDTVGQVAVRYTGQCSFCIGAGGP